MSLLLRKSKVFELRLSFARDDNFRRVPSQRPLEPRATRCALKMSSGTFLETRLVGGRYIPRVTSATTLRASSSGTSLSGHAIEYRSNFELREDKNRGIKSPHDPHQKYPLAAITSHNCAST